MLQHFVQVPVQVPYFTQGSLSPETRHLWFVFHGYGQLAQYFIRKFEFLPTDHFVVAPQGLAKFYIQPFDKVGASWLTKEDRLVDIANQQNYLDMVLDNIKQQVDLQKVSINLLGFSQGVSTVSRWAVQRQLAFDRLILWAGMLPQELKASDFSFIKPSASIQVVIGKQDQFYNEIAIQTQLQKLAVLGLKPQLEVFDGKHEVEIAVLKKISTWIDTPESSIRGDIASSSLI